MSKVKHLLRKLHIGDHHHHGRPPSALDPSPQTTPSQPSTSSSPPSDLSLTTLASESESLSNSNFNFFEEEFQMQLALAISVSDQGQNCVDPETAQINAAKQISLGCTPSHNVSEFLSLRYWSCNVVNYDEKVADGFYDVCGIDSNLVVQAKMPSLVELGAISALDDVGCEVVLVNRAVDMDLRHLEERVYYMSLELHTLDKTLNTTFLVQKIADLIVERMGGPVRDVEEMFRRWRARNRELRIYLNTIILPLGSLDIGHSRQRALLFKVLADRINLPCKLVKGSYYTGTDEGAVNLIKLDDGSEYIIDLMGAPGTLIPAEVPGGHHQNFRSYLPIVDEAPKTKNPSSESSANATESNREGRRVVGNIQKELLKDDVGNQPEFTRELMSMCSEKCASISKELFPNINSHDSREELLKGNGLVRRDGFVDQCHAEIYLSKKEQSLVPYTGFQCNSSIKHSAEGNQSSPSIQGDQSVHLKDSNDDTISNNDVTVHRELVDFSDQSNSNKIHNVQIDPVLNGVAEILWEDLQIGERIGIGSYGEVYRAEWNGTEVAVKKFMKQDISGDALAQFKCEIEIMLRLRHPNVVLFMGAVTRPPNMSILTEFLPRGSLYRLLHRPNIHIDEKRRIKMALDVAKGMNYLHTSHPIIVHRDLKTPNLLVDKNWVVKVCDFGMSRLQHHTYLSSKSAAGTAEWMAPEVLRNEPSNEKSDVYSFGVILWELATLRVPWTEMNSMQVVGAVGFQGRNLEIPPTVDPLVAEIISDCWIRNPNERPSFKQIISRLKCLQRLNVQRSDNRVNLK